uniref:WenL n=1 Tax=Proteus vulgaris TaxID=585 RepID=D9YZ51_PROVU|nr:WenL [Proteus vulgaris]
MKKIAFVITKSELGGAQTWVLELYRLLSKKYDIYLITSEFGWPTDKFPPEKVFLINGIKSLSKPTTIYKLAFLLKKLNIQLSISSSANAGIYTRLSKCLYLHKTIYVSHGWSCIYNTGKLKYISCMIERLLSLITNKVLCISNSDMKKAIETIKISEKKLCLISNKIIPKPMKKSNDIKKTLKIVFVGRLSYPKAPDLLIDSIKDIPLITLDIIGNGEYMNELKNKYSKYKNIKLLGAVDDFSSYNNYDLFILSSFSEGLPMSGIEAGSAGLPLMLSNVGGCYELIDVRKPNGILFDNNKESIQQGLNEIINNYNFYAENAKKCIKNFDINYSEHEYINLIEKQFN